MNEPERRDAGGGDLTQQENEPPTSAGGAAATERGSKRKAKAPIGSVGELIRRNYESRAGVKKLQRTDVRAIVQAPALEETEQAELLALARADTKLQQTKQLLMLSIRTETPKIANGIRGFAREVLAGHPLFQGKTMAGVLANPQSMSMDAAVSALASADAKGLSTDPDKPLPRGQADRIRTNAVHCLLLLLRASQGLSLLRIQRALHKHVCGHATASGRSLDEVTSAVVTIPVDMEGHKRRALRDAFGQAGVRIAQFVHEPFAALYGFFRRGDLRRTSSTTRKSWCSYSTGEAERST